MDFILNHTYKVFCSQLFRTYVCFTVESTLWLTFHGIKDVGAGCGVWGLGVGKIIILLSVLRLTGSLETCVGAGLVTSGYNRQDSSETRLDKRAMPFFLWGETRGCFTFVGLNYPEFTSTTSI
jgi:hypothetical protein